MTDNALLQAGLTAARAGDMETAAALFARVVKLDPKSEQGWLGLGFCFSDQKKRQYCFRRVIAINPGNPQAKQALELIEDSLSPPTPVPTSPITQTEAQSESLTSTPRPVSPFLTGSGNLDEEEKPDFFNTVSSQPSMANPSFAEVTEISNGKKIDKNEENTVQAEGGESSKSLPSSLQTTTDETIAEIPDVTDKKNKTPFIAIVLAILIPLLICVAGVGYLFFSGQLARLIPSSPPPTSISTPLPVNTPVFTLTPTSTRTPTSTATPLPPSPTHTPAPLTTLSYTPIFSDTTCWFSVPASASVTCGYVSVPQDRYDPSSNNIKLAVAIYHATKPDPAAVPVVFLQGGPGGAAVKLTADNYGVLVEPFLAKRDFIAFDQRGTGLSIPALGCDELEQVYKQDIAGQIPVSSREYIYTNAFRSCHGSLEIAGIDLASYTTQAGSDDLKDIVTALGYNQVDLYSVSYGTRLALITMRDHPEIVQSAALDSVVPVEVKLYDEQPLLYRDSLQALFDTCAENMDCNSSYPDLGNVFWDLVAKLDSDPVKISVLLPDGTNTEYVSGSDLIGMTLSLLKSTSLISIAPRVIFEVNAGDYSAFKAVQSSLPYEFQGINIGLYVSVMCHEQILASTAQDLQTAMDSNHDVGRYFWLPFFGDAKSFFKTCDVWGAQPPTPGENSPVTSDIPTLIIEGKFDPTTPPSFGKQVAENLSSSYYMELPDAGHTPTTSDPSGCAFQTMLAFFDDPKTKPDMNCLSEISPISFITPDSSSTLTP